MRNYSKQDNIVRTPHINAVYACTTVFGLEIPLKTFAFRIILVEFLAFQDGFRNEWGPLNIVTGFRLCDMYSVDH